jgi:predicted MFS family arabinose efflux permease
MLGGSLGVAVLQLLHVPAADTGQLWVLLIVRVLTGAASSAMYLSQATVATELPNPEHRDRVFALFSTTVLVGFAVGQVFGEMVMQAHGFVWAFAVSAAFASSSTIVSLALPETRPADAVPAASVSDLFHPAAVRIGMVNLLVFVGFMGFNAFIADYAEEFGINDARWLLLTYSLTVMAMRVASAKVFMRVPRRALATFAHCAVVAGALLLATADGVPQLYVAAFVIAVGMAWNVPLLILIAVDSATDAERSRAVATVTTFGDLANSAGTLALGFVAESVGYDGMYVVVAGSALAALVLMRSPFMASTRGLHLRPAGAAG